MQTVLMVLEVAAALTVMAVATVLTVITVATLLPVGFALDGEGRQYRCYHGYRLHPCPVLAGLRPEGWAAFPQTAG